MVVRLDGPSPGRHTGKSRGPRRRFLPSLIIISLAVVAAIGVAWPSIHNALNSTLGTAPPVPAAAPVHTVRYEVSGSGTAAAVSYVIAGDGSTTPKSTERLPWSTEVQVRRASAPFTQVTVKAVQDTSSGTSQNNVTSCKIIVDGRTVAENTTSGSSSLAFVDCDAIIR
jgi:hypothetical protein